MVADFFKQADLQQRLKIVDEEERITGWEAWLQVKFACFLIKNKTIGDWKREFLIAFDGRKERDKMSFRPDFLLRKKGWKIASYVALEMKQSPEAVICIRNMLRDIEKVSKAKGSELDLRNFYALGICRYRKDFSESVLKQELRIDKKQKTGLDKI